MLVTPHFDGTKVEFGLVCFNELLGGYIRSTTICWGLCLIQILSETGYNLGQLSGGCIVLKASQMLGHSKINSNDVRKDAKNLKLYCTDSHFITCP